MDYERYFLVQIKRNRESGLFDKGVAVKETLDAARQSYHAYLGAYGYGHDATVDYVACYIVDLKGVMYDWMVDNRIEADYPEGE